MFSDQYIDKEENSRIVVCSLFLFVCWIFFKIRHQNWFSNQPCGALCLKDVVLQWLMTDGVQLNQIDAEDPEVSAIVGSVSTITCRA